MTDNLNSDLRDSLKEEISKRGNIVAYISSEPQEEDKPYYLSTIKDYKEINNDIQVDYFDLSESFSDEDIDGLLKYGVIYLSGGNTYVFMSDAKKRNLYSILEKHLKNDGLVIGASAGSIMMTLSIDLAFIEDENTPNLKDTKGFGFVDFEFHPHFSESDYSFLSEYVERKKTKIYICKDGDGMFYSDGNIKLFGEVSEFVEK
ncbi:MAG: peptidase S51, dipeptidase E [Parcubacteria group bacterium LiPW_30]|nr:MAG: peptidase S51, dipeptidase E [Parcubacteria group bacterium LiPW_30]